MNLEPSERTKQYLDKLRAFMDAHIYPNEEEMLSPARRAARPLAGAAAARRAQEEGAGGGPLEPLPAREPRAAPGLTNLEYAFLCEEMGKVGFAPEVFNCSAPDTGNMEVSSATATRSRRSSGSSRCSTAEIRSAFAMTEPAVASSDATNIETEIRREGDQYVINGRKWFTSGIHDPRCKILILMGKTDPEGRVAPPAEHDPRAARHAGDQAEPLAAGLRLRRRAARPRRRHVRQRARPGEEPPARRGRGFEIAQGRLGPGRIHHCMRTIGVAERALAKMCNRLLSRTAFGKRIAEHSVWEERVADARIEIECARLLTLKAAWMMDTVGNKVARGPRSR